MMINKLRKISDWNSLSFAKFSNSLSFPCREFLLAIFPVFPVPWVPWFNIGVPKCYGRRHTVSKICTRTNICGTHIFVYLAGFNNQTGPILTHIYSLNYINLHVKYGSNLIRTFWIKIWKDTKRVQNKFW